MYSLNIITNNCTFQHHTLEAHGNSWWHLVCMLVKQVADNPSERPITALVGQMKWEKLINMNLISVFLVL